MNSRLQNLLRGNRRTHRFCDEKGNRISFSRLMRNGPKAFFHFSDANSSTSGLKSRGFPTMRGPCSLGSCREKVLCWNSARAIQRFGSRSTSPRFTARKTAEWYDIVRGMLSGENLKNVIHCRHAAADYVEFPEAAQEKSISRWWMGSAVTNVLIPFCSASSPTASPTWIILTNTQTAARLTC